LFRFAYRIQPHLYGSFRFTIMDFSLRYELMGCPFFEHGRRNKRAANFVAEKIKIFVFFLAKPEKNHDAKVSKKSAFTRKNYEIYSRLNLHL